MKWTRSRCTLEMRNEPMYSFGSTDNSYVYEKELLLARRDSVTSRHGMVLFDDGVRGASLVIGAGAGPTGVHERSAILLEDLCFIVVGSELVCLAVPSLDVRWHHDADPATCFRLHLTPDEQAIVVHGELEISKWTFDGEQVWSFGGADIFTGELSIIGRTVVVADFEGRVYRIDLGTGQAEQGSA